MIVPLHKRQELLFRGCEIQALPMGQVYGAPQALFVHGKRQHPAVLLRLPHGQGGQHRYPGALGNHAFYGLRILQSCHDVQLLGVVSDAGHVLLQRPIGAGALFPGNGRLPQKLVPRRWRA